MLCYRKWLQLFTCSVPGGRLECTMQNIADNFLNTYPSRYFKDVEGIILVICSPTIFHLYFLFYALVLPTSPFVYIRR